MSSLNDRPLISGITIFYNAETQYFEEAIASVLAQTYSNWELFLVDDGSTNESTQLAKDYANRYPDKIYYLEHPQHQNRGMSASRNLGISNARGEYIAFLDADDIWLPEKLERQLATLQANPQAGAVFNPTLYWYSWTGKPEDSQRDELRQLGIASNHLFHPPTLLAPLIARKINTPGTCSILLRKSVFAEIGNFEENFRGMFEDRAFFTKMYLKIPVFVEDKYWDKYRQHSDSESYRTQKTGEYHPVKLNPANKIYLNWLKDYLLANNIEDSDIWQAFHRKMLPYKYPWLGATYYFLTNFYYQNKDRLRLFWKKNLPFPIPTWLSSDKAQTNLES